MPRSASLAHDQLGHSRLPSPRLPPGGQKLTVASIGIREAAKLISVLTVASTGVSFAGRIIVRKMSAGARIGCPPRRWGRLCQLDFTVRAGWSRATSRPVAQWLRPRSRRLPTYQSVLIIKYLSKCLLKVKPMFLNTIQYLAKFPSTIHMLFPKLSF